MTGISLKQKDILDFIAGFIRERGYSPSVRDVAKGCSLSSSSIAQYHLKVLEREGYIRRAREISRGIELVKRKRGVVEVPLLGTIAAGEPIPVPSPDTWGTVPEESLEVPVELTRGFSEVYALKVRGISMIDALIDEGDIVIMGPVSTAEDGQLVAVWLKDRQEVTLKKIYWEVDRIRLQPANRTINAIYCRPEDVEVQGKVIGVIRKVAYPFISNG